MMVLETGNEIGEPMGMTDFWVTSENPDLLGRVLIRCFVFWSLSVITEAAILKKHNLFEDNMALPSESVSSLTDLKTSMGSNQASPARRVSAILPGTPDNEPPTSEVFQEPEEKKQQLGVPGLLAREESTSISGSSPPSGGEEQVSVSSVDNSAGSPLTAENNTAGPLSSHLSEVEVGETLKDEEPTCERPESSTSTVPGSLKELKELLTVTVSIESVPVIENDIHNGTPVPQENQKEEESKIHPEASQPAASQQDSYEESKVREKEAHSMPLEAEALGVDLGTLSEGRGSISQSTSGGLTENTSCLGPIEEPSEAQEPAEKVCLAIVSPQDSPQEGDEAVHSVTVTPQEDATFSSNPICPVEWNEVPQVSEDQQVLGGNDSPALAMDTEQVSAAHVHGCQWVVEDAPSTDILAVHDDVSSPEQPSEEW